MKKLTKKLVMLAVCGLSMGALNAQVCSIGTNTYATLDLALAAVPTGDTTPTVIKLLTDITYPNRCDIGNKKITFNLNGKSLIFTNLLYVFNHSAVDYSGTGEFKVVRNLNDAGNSLIISALGVDSSTCTLTGSEITDNGTGTNRTVCGVHCYNNATATVNGNVKAICNATGGAKGAYAEHNSNKITIDGTITVPSGHTYIQVGTTYKSINNYEAVTTKVGYFTYTDGSNTVWVKDPSSVTTYTITATAGTGGSISPSGNITVNAGEDTTFTFSENNSNYAIVQVFIDDTNNPAAVAAGSYTFTNVSANHKIEVYFKPTVGIVGAGHALPLPRIYPNPTTGQLRVSGDIGDSGDREIRIFNVVGQVVFTSQLSELSPETTIDISHLANGLYFLKIDNKVIKISKEK